MLALKVWNSELVAVSSFGVSLYLILYFKLIILLALKLYTEKKKKIVELKYIVNNNREKNHLFIYILYK